MEIIEIITDVDLTTYLGASAAGTDEARIALLVDLTNGLISDTWANPTDEIPTWVRTIALEVAARPLRNPRGLSSVTRAADDASRTERLSETAARSGVFLTAEEEARLRGRGSTRRRGRYGTIRIGIG